jgi:GPH family glycoside/pentoside/hexuronide:cation symporter
VNGVSRRSRLAFAISGIPTVGIIYNGIDYFLFFFYSQIVGLSSALVGMAIATALVVDAFSDPLVGYLSDNWKSRLGRRHPFMYASIVPISALYLLIWHPPFEANQQFALFGYLLAVAILLRLSMTMFDVPTRALVAELTSDYDERTRLGSLPITVAWITSSVMVIAMYTFWLDDSAEYVNGSLNGAGYQEAALVCAAIVLLALLLTSVGLHPEIPRLHKKTARQAIGMRDLYSSMGELLQNRSMRALILSGLFIAAGTGTTAALWIYHYSAFFGMNSDQMSALAIAQLLATFGVIPVVRRFVVKGDKKVMAIRFLVASVLITLILPPLLVLGWLPERGSDGLFYLVLVYDFFSQVIWIVALAIIYSMFADVTEDLLLQSGRRLEGAIFAFQTFIEKSAGAFGALLAGALLTAINFPKISGAAELPDDALARLGLGYTIAWAVLASIGIWILSTYAITRSSHAEEVAALETAPCP